MYNVHYTVYMQYISYQHVNELKNNVYDMINDSIIIYIILNYHMVKANYRFISLGNQNLLYILYLLSIDYCNYLLHTNNYQLC